MCNPLTGQAVSRKVRLTRQTREARRKVSKMMQEQTANSYLFGGNAPYVEELYEAYLDNPGSVPDNWRAYFDSMQNVPAVDGSNKPDVAHASVIASFAMSPYDNWRSLAWGGALLITFSVLALNILSRTVFSQKVPN